MSTFLGVLYLWLKAIQIMPSYDLRNIVELVTDDYFLESCLSPTAESEMFWEEWCAINIERLELWKEARAIILSLAQGRKNYALVRLPEEKVEALWQRIKSVTVAEVETTAISDVVRPLWPKKMMWIAAASVGIILSVGGWLLLQPQRPLSANSATEFVELATQSLREVRNTSKLSKIIKLSDGSLITLSPNARIQYAESFQVETRTVYLTGEAIFDIKHDVKRPFLVYANDLVTKVLGTQFKIITNSETTNVSVISGKVSVVRREELDVNISRAFVLLPNQQVIYDANKQKFSKTIVEKPIMVNKPNNLQAFSFEDTPISSVFTLLEKVYEIKIIYDESTFSGCTLTSTLTSQTLYTKLDLICEAIHAKYEIVDGQIVVSGEGCQ